MNSHRLTAPLNEPVITKTSQPFSGFGYIEGNFVNTWVSIDPIRRLFSLARSLKSQILISEEISPCGIIEDENNEIVELGLSHKMTGLLRLSFWNLVIESAEEIAQLEDSNLKGYAILKRDISDHGDNWHVFEAVFEKYPHEHNCIPRSGQYAITVGGRSFKISGVLYSQQNGLNKACAHVALRSLLSRILPEGDISYRKINVFARNAIQAQFKPSDGLSTIQIRGVLSGLGIQYSDIDYTIMEAINPDIRKIIPYQKIIYSGIENGAGALLGFRLKGPRALDEKHIVPFYGHTFNKDTWAPDAELSYFNVGSNIRYIPSESWTSSFLGHDDNFGPNFCVPRLYIEKDQVDYAVELRPNGVQYSGMLAEAIALGFLDSLIPQINDNDNVWLKRLKEWVSIKKVILRALSLRRDEYLNYLKNQSDWDDHKEEEHLCNNLENNLPELLWAVEVSIPHLFPANERKIGEIVLNGMTTIDKNNLFDPKTFLFARFPTSYHFIASV